MMKIKEIVELLSATIHYEPQEYDVDIVYAGASDLMSDVLAYMNGMPTHVSKGMILITGLVNLQVIRTVTLMDISMVIFTRGKILTEKIIEEAKNINIPILSTTLTSYTACGLLYSAGILGVEREKSRE
ncbi:MAG: DRTGG domain-containing protein [Thermoplasmata archaeon]